MDTKQTFIEAIRTGRELEFRYAGQQYFASRRSDSDWYLYHEESQQEQHFSSAEDFLAKTLLQNRNINELWTELEIDYIL